MNYRMEKKLKKFETSGELKIEHLKQVWLSLTSTMDKALFITAKIISIWYFVNTLVNYKSFTKVLFASILILVAFCFNSVLRRLEFTILKNRMKNEDNIDKSFITSYFTNEGVNVTNQLDHFYPYSEFTKYVITDKALFLIMKDKKTLIPIFYKNLRDEDKKLLYKELQDKGIFEIHSYKRKSNGVK